MTKGTKAVKPKQSNRAAVRQTNAYVPKAQRPPKDCDAQDLKSWKFVDPAMNSAVVALTFQHNLFGSSKENSAAEHSAVTRHIERVTRVVDSGNLLMLEEILVGQALALQTLFASLTRGAKFSNSLPKFQTYMQLGLKAQAQSRATVQAIVELKYPRQVAFVKQANIATGPQQVNNGSPADARAHAEKLTSPTKLLDFEHEQRLEPSAAQTTSAANSQMEAVGAVHRASKPKWQGEGSQKRIQGR